MTADADPTRASAAPPWLRDWRDCPHNDTVDVVGCLPEGGVAEGWECRDCGYHTW